MFKSLLRTIPSVSGNFTLACRLNDIYKKSNKEYKAYINSAILLPLDNNTRLFKDINVNLSNSKYEYDIPRYWRLISDSFYTDTYLINETIFDDYDLNPIHLKDNRDKTFEFGCSRLPVNYTNYQFRFYAPIYINDPNDLPDSFNIYIKNQDNQILKKIIIPIAENININKLRIYLYKFISKLQGNIPAYWNFSDNKIVYKNVIDCKNGGLINFSSYNVIKNNSSQVVINDFDNSISAGYSSNNIIMSEVIPLSFMFNIEDFIDPEDLYYFYFNNFIISGSYVKNGIQQAFYDFDINYHYKDIYYKNIDSSHGIYNIDSYNLFSNSVSNSYQEGTEIRLYYENTLTHNYFRWKKFESSDYIINANGAYTSEYDRYGEFPILKNSTNVISTYIVNSDESNIYNNLIFPVNKYKNYFASDQISSYEYICNNYYSDWFEIYDENNLFNVNWSKVIYNYVYHKGIYYKLDEDIDYFNVFVNPIIYPYNENRILADWCLEYKDSSSNTIITTDKIVDNMSYIQTNKYLDPVDNIDDLTDEDKIYIKYDDTFEYVRYSDIVSLIQTYTNTYILELFNKILGYEKLIKFSNSNIVNDDSILLYSVLYYNRDLFNQLYYSESNSTAKIQLKDYLESINFNPELFKANKFSFFVKDFYVYLYKPDEIYDKIDYIVYDNNSSSLYSKYGLKYPNCIKAIQDNLAYALNQLKNGKIISDNLFYDIFTYELVLNKDKEEINYILEYVLFLLKYTDLISSFIKNNNIQKYNYIPYYNDHDVTIDYDYFRPIGDDNINYNNLYIDSFNLSNYLSNYNLKLSKIKQETTDVFVNITNKSILDAYLDELYNSESFIKREDYDFLNNLYHCEAFLNDKLETEYKIIKLIDYLNLFSSFSFTISTETLLYIFKNYASFNNNLITFTLPMHNKPFTITCNLFYKKKMYVLNKEFYKKCLQNNIPLYIYKSLNNVAPNSYKSFNDKYYNKFTSVSPFNLVKSAFDTVFYDYDAILQQQILLKNMTLINNKYVYQNPQYIFKEVKLDEYLTEYKNTQLYTLSKINETNNSGSLQIIEHEGKKYGYILLNYYFDLSSNSFNLYTADSNDNIEIKLINGKSISQEYINVIFKNIYPYMKQDILISNYNDLKKYMILPENLSLIIDKQVIYYPSYTKLEKSEKNIRLYINRYFGNIDPLFIKVDNTLIHQYSKLFKSTQNNSLSNEMPQHNNLIEENFNIYQYNPVTYISDKYRNDYICSTDKQVEYKHFNDNNLYVLPQELTFTHDDVEYFEKDNIKDYANEEACFKYFKRYVKSKYYSKLSDNLLLFLFKKYTINKYEESIVKYNLQIKKKYCTITYNLSLN